MRIHSPHRFWTALLLALVFTAAGLLRATHGLIAHRDQHRHDRPHCAVADKPGTHWHDERYAVKDCPICDFWFATPDLFAVVVLPTVSLVPAERQQPCFALAVVPTEHDAIFGRGPPVW